MRETLNGNGLCGVISDTRLDKRDKIREVYMYKMASLS